MSKFRGLVKTFSLIHIPAEEKSEEISQEVNLVIHHRVDQLAIEMELQDEIKGVIIQRLRSMQHRTYL